MVARLLIAGEVQVNEATAIRGLKKRSLGFRDSKVAREEEREFNGDWSGGGNDERLVGSGEN
jgi:hypothetical protein